MTTIAQSPTKPVTFAVLPKSLLYLVRSSAVAGVVLTGKSVIPNIKDGGHG
jgi:hypothetical protein